MPDIFISYSRQEREFVTKLSDTLMQRGIITWVDLNDIPPTAQFVQEIYLGIEGSDNFVFIISPTSVISEICNTEVAHARKLNKRIIPILYKEVNVKILPQNPVKSLLDQINWLRTPIDSDVATLCENLIQVLESDLEYVRFHTRLLVRAREWETQECNDAYLLRSKDLDTAESWLQAGIDKKPQPTELHHRYVRESKRHQLEENNKWEELYRTADENRRNAEIALASFYKEQGRSELIKKHSAKAISYLSEAYTLGSDDSALKLLLAQAAEGVDNQLYTLRGHSDIVATVEFSPGGSQLISASWDKTARIWSVSSGEEIAVLHGHTAPLNIAIYSPDGLHIATAGQDNLVIIWNAHSFDPRSKLIGHSSSVGFMQFSQDGNLIITASGEYSSEIHGPSEETVDATARIWSVRKGELIQKLEHPRAVTCAAFSPNSSKVATGSVDGSVRIWDGQTGECSFIYSLNPEQDKQDDNDVFAISLAFSPDGTQLVASGGDRVTMWNLSNGSVMFSSDRHMSNINNISFSPDGSMIATCSVDKSAIIWDSKNGKMISRLEGHSASVTSAGFNPDGQTILTTSMDATAKLWEVRGGRLIENFEGHRAEIVHASFNQDGTQLATASWDKTITLWKVQNNRFRPFSCTTDLMFSAAFNEDGSKIVTIGLTDSHDPDVSVWNYLTGELLFCLNGHAGIVEDASFSSQGNYIVTSGADKTARLWNSTNGELISTLVGHTDTVKSSIFSSDGRFIATASLDGTAKLWMVPTGALLHTLKDHDASLFSVRFSPTNRLVVTASDDGQAIVWNVANGESLFYLKHTAPLHMARFSPDSQYVLTASEDQTAKIWNSSNGQLLRTLEGHTGNVFTIDITGDSTRVLTASADKSAKIWDVATGRLICSLDEHEGMVWDARFSYDGNFVISIDTEGQAAKVWDSKTGALLSILENPTGMTTCALFSPNDQSAVTTLSRVIFNPNVYLTHATYSISGSTLIAWNLPLEIRDPNLIGRLVKERIPYSIREGRLLPITL